MVEYIAVPNRMKKLQELDFIFIKVSQDMKITDEQNHAKYTSFSHFLYALALIRFPVLCFS
ncbi:MAG: hypothetical protein LBP88_05055 [Treponema sp.]|nr:hypothetical protein [Treponema sp.]